MGSAADLLAAWFQIAFDHHAFYQLADILRVLAVVHNLPHNTDLLFVLLVGVGMVGVDDDRRIFQISLSVFFQQKLNILIVIVRDCVSVLVDRAPQDRMSQGLPVVFTSQFR